jgi:hypothetical protein
MATAATVTRRASRFQHYPPGAEETDARPGDFLLTHSRSWTERLIRFVERGQIPDANEQVKGRSR